MATLAELTEQDLLTTENFDRVKRFAFDCIDHLMVPESRRFADMLEKKIGPSFQNTNPELYAQYQQIIITLKFVAITTLDQRTFYNLIRFHLLDALRNGIDINERMTGRMYLLPETVFEEEKLEVIQQLKENNQRLGSQQIILRDDKEPVAPLVKYWIADYDRWYGPEKHSGLQRQQYLMQNQNVRSLSREDKTILAEILEFYDNLKPIPISTIDKYLGLTEGETSATRGQGSMPIGAPEQKPLSEHLPAQSEEPERTPQPTPPAPPTNLPQKPPQMDSYKEQIEEQDMSGPFKQSARPAPRISGNIIDLKDIDKL